MSFALTPQDNGLAYLQGQLCELFTYGLRKVIFKEENCMQEIGELPTGAVVMVVRVLPFYSKTQRLCLSKVSKAMVIYQDLIGWIQIQPHNLQGIEHKL